MSGCRWTLRMCRQIFLLCVVELTWVQCPPSPQGLPTAVAVTVRGFRASDAAALRSQNWLLRLPASVVRALYISPCGPRPKNEKEKKNFVHKRRQRLHKTLFSTNAKAETLCRYNFTLSTKLSKVHCNSRQPADQDTSGRARSGKDAEMIDLTGHYVVVMLFACLAAVARIQLFLQLLCCDNALACFEYSVTFQSANSRPIFVSHSYVSFRTTYVPRYTAPHRGDFNAVGCSSSRAAKPT